MLKVYCFFVLNKSDEEDHRFHTLNRKVEELKDEFGSMLGPCAAKVTETCKLEKKTWLMLDSLIEKCKSMVEEVKKTTEEQVRGYHNNVNIKCSMQASSEQRVHTTCISYCVFCTNFKFV